MSDFPTATASGPDAATPSAISPVRAGIGAGVLAAILVLVTVIVTPVPGRALALVGADADGLGRYGGMQLVWAPPPGADSAKVEMTFATRHTGARVTRVHSEFVVEVPGMGPDEVARASSLIVAGGVEFHRCVRSPEMIRLVKEYGIPLEDPAAAVSISSDKWMPEDGGERRTDYYLYAQRREDIEAVVAGVEAKGWSLPDDLRIAYEHVDGWDGKPDFWRSYVIERAVGLGGDHVADAIGSYDPNTNRPIVLLDFDREGAQIFGELTGSMVGEKLATMIGGDVASAPIINGAIRGGRASITMGGSDPAKQERERDALVGVLKAGQLPPGGELRAARYVPPSTSALREWIARILAAFGAGLVVGLIAWALVRTTRPVWRTPIVRLPGRIAWWRLAVMLVAPAVLIATSFVTAPGLDTDQLLYVLRDDSQFSLGMLGVAPLLSGFVVIELVTTLVPGWRRRRHAGATARWQFDLAAIVLSLVFAGIQAWFVSAYLETIDASPLGFDRVLFLASMCGMTMVFAGIAALIRRYGVGNGYGGLLATSLALGIYRVAVPDSIIASGWSRTTVHTSDIVLAVLALVVFGLAIGVLLRWRIARVGEPPLRVPTSGISPMGNAEGLLSIVFAALGMIPIGGLAETMWSASSWLHDLNRGIALAIGVGFAVLWSWAFARPAVLTLYADRAKLAPPSRESWRAATLLTAGMLVLIAGSYTFLGSYPSNAMLGTLPAMMFAAVALDAYDDLCGRRGKLVRVWALHGAQHADLATHVLGEDCIPFHLTGANLRTLLAWFGPFVPVDVWVPPEHAERARERLANVFAPK